MQEADVLPQAPGACCGGPDHRGGTGLQGQCPRAPRPHTAEGGVGVTPPLSACVAPPAGQNPKVDSPKPPDHADGQGPSETPHPDRTQGHPKRRAKRWRPGLRVARVTVFGWPEQALASHGGRGPRSRPARGQAWRGHVPARPQHHALPGACQQVWTRTRGRARRTRGQSGHPAREWSAHWASPGAGGGGRGGCRPVSLQGRGESSWWGGPVVARRPGAGGSEGANVRSPWEVTQPLLRVRQPLSGSCRRQALVPRQRLVLTPDPVLALPARGRSRELCRPCGRFQELSGNAEAAKGLAFEEGPAGHVGAGSRDEGRCEGPLGT